MNVDDGYLGSGKALIRAFKKYGKEPFIRIILHHCLSERDAFDIETDIVDDAFVRRRDTYNSAIGGKGGDMVKYMSPDRKSEMYRNIMANRKPIIKTPEHKAKLSQHMKSINQLKKGVSMSDEQKQKRSVTQKGRPKNFSPEELARRSSTIVGNTYGALNKRQWRLVNTLGHEYIIDNLPQFCSDMGINPTTLTTCYRAGHKKQSSKRFWEISKLN
jgi:hypothetical protein